MVHNEIRSAALLATLPLFCQMQEDELERIAATAVLRRVARGETVFNRGDPCDGFHVVVRGQVKLFALSPSGQEKVIEIIAAGQSFAEALMFLGRPYIVSAAALCDSLILHVNKQAVLQEIEREPKFALRMLAGISQRLHSLVHDVEGYALLSGQQRVIGYLLREHAGALEADDLDGDVAVQPQVVHLEVTKATLASRLSLTPEYFSRVLHELREAGLIEVSGRHIRIPDARRLAAYQM